MDFNEAFELDQKLVQEGRWFPVGEGAHCKIARTGNPKYKELLRAKLGIYEQSLSQKLLDDDTADTVLIEVMAKTILLDWKGFTDQGKEVKYSVTAAIEYMSKFEEFRSFVARNADNMQAYKAKASEVDRGNLPTELDGTSSGEEKNDS